MIARVLCVALLSGAAFGQLAVPPPSFEAADIHTSANARRPFFRGRTAIHDDRYEMRNANLVDLITAAYGVRPENVIGGPSWLELDRFDMMAKMGAEATPDQRRAMLQALLAERFKLVVHKDPQPVAAFVLTAGKHPTLKKADDSKPSGCNQSMPPPTPRNGLYIPSMAEACTNMTMKAFAERLGYSVPNLNRQVVDQTELEGAWDFTFKYTFPGLMAESGTITIFDAMEKQLGLKLSAAKVPLPVIVVDRVNQKPTDNTPAAMDILREGPPPTEFEVADVKPFNPDSGLMMMQPRIQRGGRVVINGITLKRLIEQTWNITDEMLIGAPKFTDTDRFDIIAKAPVDSPSGDVDPDALWPMLQGLLKERFHLAVHNEDRVIPAYTLLAGKPKLKKADPNSRTRYQEGPAPDGKDPSRSRLVTCQNMTMAQFAERLQTIAPDYLHGSVLDATGIEGAYDFTLLYGRAGFVARAGRGGGGRGGDPGSPSAGRPLASDPDGAVSLFEALEKLGLKLELQKRKLPVLVIDHIDQKPTDN